MEWVRNDFRTARNRDQIEKPEDYSLGWPARAQLGYAARAVGSTRDAFTFNGNVAKGLALSSRQTLQFNLDATGRLEAGAFADTVFGGQARYYFRQSPRRL